MIKDDMRINLSIEQENILQIVTLFIIGLLCDAFIFSIITTLYIPEVGWGVHHYTKFVLLYRQFFFKYLYSNISTISLIIGTIFLVFFKLFLFLKIVISIENSKNQTKTSKIIKDIHNNKYSILSCFIIFCLLSFLFIDGYSDIYNLSNKITYFFVIPLHYLFLYLYWENNDIKNPNLTNMSDNSNTNIQLIKYILITNPFFIIISWITLFSILLDKFPLFEYLFVFIFIALIILLTLFYLFIMVSLFVKSVGWIIKFVKKQ